MNLRYLAGVAIFVILAGCGDGRPRRVPVAGQVLIDGKPLTKGVIRLAPKNARASQGTLDEQGRFRLTTFDGDDGAVLGEHALEIIAREPLSPTKIRWLAPPKLAQASTSGKTVSITGPTDSLVVEISWEGGAPFVEETATGGDADPTADPLADPRSGSSAEAPPASK